MGVMVSETARGCVHCMLGGNASLDTSSTFRRVATAQVLAASTHVNAGGAGRGLESRGGCGACQLAPIWPLGKP